jgi:hypothetical protein
MRDHATLMRCLTRPTTSLGTEGLASPADATKLIEVGTALGSLLPDLLVALYRANDGLFDRDGQWWVIWPLAQMVEAKAWLARFDGYLERWVPLGDDGTGDPFCFHRADQVITRLSTIDGIHETFAHGLADFWTMATTLNPNGKS